MNTITFQGTTFDMNKLTVHAKLSTFVVFKGDLANFQVNENPSPIKGEVLIAVPRGKTVLNMMVGHSSGVTKETPVYVMTPYQLKQCKA